MRYTTAVISAAALSLTAWCANAQDAEQVTETAPEIASEETADAPVYKDVDASTVVATVNGVDITLGHVILLRTELPEQYLSAPNNILFPAILDQLIEQQLLGGTVTDEPIEVQLSVENERRALLAGAAIQRALAEEPAEEEYQAVYDEAFADYEGEPEYNASHILVETEQEAADLVQQLTDGADFAELAKTASIGPSGPNGGELGWFGLGQMVQEFEAAVVELEVGQVSAPVQTQFGWHVIILNDSRITVPPTLDEVRGQIAQQLQRERIDATIEALTEGAQIERFIEDVNPESIADIGLVIDQQ